MLQTLLVSKNIYRRGIIIIIGVHSDLKKFSREFTKGRNAKRNGESNLLSEDIDEA